MLHGIVHIGRICLLLCPCPEGLVEWTRFLPFYVATPAEPGICQLCNNIFIMKGKLIIMLSLILSGVICSCSGKEDPSSTSVKAITLNPTSLSLKVGKTATITATVSPSNATNKTIIWSSSNASVVTVNEGVVAAIDVGTADVIALSDDGGISATCHITVTDGTGINPDPGTEDPSIHGTPVITGDYSYDGYSNVIVTGTCNVEPLMGVSVMYGIMYSNEDLTKEPHTKEVEEKDAKNRFSCEIYVEPGGTLYYYRAFATRGGETFYGEIKSFKTKELVPTPGDAIDMGVSVKWASCNLGANKPEGYGNLYAWGETQPKSSYTQDNYKYYVNGKYSKYNSSDGKKVLDLDDDAANNLLKGNWRMPTKEEYEELQDNCTQYEDVEYNGVRGFVLVSNTTENILFVPISNYYQSPYYYWTSSLNTSTNKAYYIRTDHVCGLIGDMVRYTDGYIRPVQGTSSGGNTDENKIDISVTDITSTTCVVSLHPNVSGTYFWDIIEKDTFDKYGGDYVLNYYVSYYKEEGLLGNVLDNGDSTYDYKELTSKTQYVVFAGYCDANGNVKSKVSSKTFTTK